MDNNRPVLNEHSLSAVKTLCEFLSPKVHRMNDYKVYFLGTEFGCYYFIKFLMVLVIEIGFLIYALKRINEDWTITWF